MLGGTRNGRAVKLALLVGAVLLFLYFLISWRVEAQNLSNDLAIAEEEYARIVKKLHHLENELKETVIREAKMEDSLREERQSHLQTNKAKQDLEAKCKTELDSKKKQVTLLEGEKAELHEQIQAVKADRDSKSQEAQRLTEELHDAKEAADDEYQALSATCVQNQQTCERRAKQAEDDLSSAKSQATTNYQSLQECKTQLTIQLEVADTCNTRLTSLEKEGAGRLKEIEQIQSQLHRSEQDRQKLVDQMHHEQRNSQIDHSKLEQPNIGGQALHKSQQRFDNGGGFNNDGGNFHLGGDAGVRDRRDNDGNFGGRSLREQVDTGVNNWRDRLQVADHGIRNQGDQFHGIGNRDDQFHGIGNRGGDLPGIGNRDDQFHRLGNRDDQFHGIGNRGGDLPGIGNRDDQFHRLGNRDDQFNGIRNREDQFHGVGNRDDHSLNRDSQLHRVAKESFNDFRISDEQKQNVFDSLQGKLARGEKLDERQLKILQLLSKDFSEQKNHIGEDKNNVPVRNGMGLENLQEQRKEAVDHEERDGLEGDKPKEEDQLPNPLDEGEEVKDLVEEQQKPGEFDNLGNDRKLEVIDRDQEQEPVGAGGEELKQVVAKEDQKENEGGLDHGERDLHKDERLEEEEGKGKVGKEKEGDNPLPRPIENDANLDDEDDYPGAKKDKDEEDDVYGDQAYKQDKEVFHKERLQQKFDRQL